MARFNKTVRLTECGNTEMALDTGFFAIYTSPKLKIKENAILSRCKKTI